MQGDGRGESTDCRERAKYRLQGGEGKDCRERGRYGLHGEGKVKTAGRGMRYRPN